MNHKRIEQWSVVFPPGADVYTPPELMTQHLSGQVEGRWVITSEIVGKKQGLVRTRSGSLYELGTTLPDYEKLFPEAAKRLMLTLPEET